MWVSFLPQKKSLVHRNTMRGRPSLGVTSNFRRLWPWPGHDIQQSLLSRYKALHSLARQIRQAGAGNRRENVHGPLRRLYVDVNLLSGGVQQSLLGLDESIHALPSQFG